MQFTIGQSLHARVLCGLGESINLMPLSFYQNLGLVSLKLPTVILQLTDRSIARQERVVVNVLVQVVSLIFWCIFWSYILNVIWKFHAFYEVNF